MLDAKKLCESFENALGWPYVSPGSNDSRGIDCSGLFVKAYRDQGASIYHGSNTIWRKHLSEKGQLTSASQLQPGMAVFKWNENTPTKFNDGQGDFQHIGLVTSVNPLRIVHASSAAGCVTADTKLGKWSHWGWLKDVMKEDVAAEMSPSPTGQIRIICENGRVNIRRGNGKEYSRITAVEPGTLLDYVAEADNGWVAVRYGKQVGWVMAEYCERV